MKHTAYARRIENDTYEFGHIVINDSGTKNEKRSYIPSGTRPTLDLALAANQMALEGAPRIGRAIHPTFTWSDAPMALLIKPSLRETQRVEMVA